MTGLDHRGRPTEPLASDPDPLAYRDAVRTDRLRRGLGQDEQHNQSKPEKRDQSDNESNKENQTPSTSTSSLPSSPGLGINAPPSSSHSRSSRQGSQNDESVPPVDNGSVPTSEAETEIEADRQPGRKRRRKEEKGSMDSPLQKRARTSEGTEGSAADASNENIEAAAHGSTATDPTQMVDPTEPFYSDNSFSGDSFQSFREDRDRRSDEDADNDDDEGPDEKDNGGLDASAHTAKVDSCEELTSKAEIKEEMEQTSPTTSPISLWGSQHDIDIPDEVPETSQIPCGEDDNLPDYEDVEKDESADETKPTSSVCTSSGDELLKTGGNIPPITVLTDLPSHEDAVSVTETYTGRSTTIILPRATASPSRMTEYLPDHTRVDEYDPKGEGQSGPPQTAEYRPDHDHQEEYDPAAGRTSTLSGRPEENGSFEHVPLFSAFNPPRLTVFAHKPPQTPPWVSDIPVKPGIRWKGDNLRKDRSVWDSRWQDTTSVKGSVKGDDSAASEGEPTDWASSPAL